MFRCRNHSACEHSDWKVSVDWISGWIAVNVFGLELSSVREVGEILRNDPHYIVELGLDALL